MMTFAQVNIMQISVIRNIENCCLLAWCVCLTLYLWHGTKKNKKNKQRNIRFALCTLTREIIYLWCQLIARDEVHNYFCLIIDWLSISRYQIQYQSTNHNQLPLVNSFIFRFLIIHTLLTAIITENCRKGNNLKLL